MDEGQSIDPERWVDRHGDVLYRFALLRLGNPDLAADIVQETFLEALRARDSYSGKSSERTWLVGILKHKIIDRYRKSRREMTVGDAESFERTVEAFFDRKGLWKDGPGRWKGDPGRDLERREFLAVFESCLSRLPQHFASAFTLREIDGLESEEICQILDITATNLWARLHRARLLLRACLELHWFGPKTKRP